MIITPENYYIYLWVDDITENTKVQILFKSALNKIFILIYLILL